MQMLDNLLVFELKGWWLMVQGLNDFFDGWFMKIEAGSCFI
jgi:hypothetical protein